MLFAGEYTITMPNLDYLKQSATVYAWITI